MQLFYKTNIIAKFEYTNIKFANCLTKGCLNVKTNMWILNEMDPIIEILLSHLYSLSLSLLPYTYIFIKFYNLLTYEKELM